MDTHDIRQLLLRNAKLRIESEMATYIDQQLGLAPTVPIDVIGGDARTGQPTRLLISPQLLQQPSPSVV